MRLSLPLPIAPRVVRAAAFLGLIFTVMLILAGSAAAHPLGNFTVNRYSGLHVLPGAVRIDYVVDLAEIPTFQEMPRIDTNGDGRGDAAELQAWVTETALRSLANLELTIDGEAVALELRSAAARLRPGQGGLATLRSEAVLVAEIADRGQLGYHDGNDPGRIGWREIVAAGEEGAVLDGSTVPSSSVSDALLSYPQDLLSSPLDVTSMEARFEPGASVTPRGTERPAPATPGARPGVEGGLFAGLVANHGLGLVMLGLVVAVAFGAWHALLPGHGKTLMAAYMVGSGARVRQAVAVGSAVAVMHTASVLGLGMLVLTLERTFRPEALYPWLGLSSGLVALALGAHLLIGRLSTWSAARRSEDPAQPHHEDHHHNHGHAPDHGHAHPAPAGPLSRRGLTTLALAGGMLPAPSALLVMLASINAHRVGYGLALVVAFGIGLAAALIVIGIGALRVRDAMAKRLSSTMGRLVPVLSAAAIVVVGLALTLRGLAQV